MNSTPPARRFLRSLLACLLFAFALAASAQAPPTVIWQGIAANTYILNPLALSPDGSVVATLGTNKTIQLWGTSNGAPLRALSGHGLWIGDLAFSADGAYLASGGGDSAARVWRTSDWSLAYAVPTAAQGPPVAFSPDSTTLAVGNGPNIELRQAVSGTLAQSWAATSGWWLTALVFSPDGTKLASGAGARGLDTSLKIWDVASGTLLKSIPTAQTYSVGCVVFSPVGLQVLTGSDYLSSGPLQAWRVSDGALLQTFPLAAYSMVFSTDGSVLAAVGTNIMFFRASDGTVTQEYSDGFASHTAGPKGIALTPTGGLFLRSRGMGEVLAGRVPVKISVPAVQDRQVTLRWVGGTGRYQLQSAPAPGGPWQDEGGPVTTNAAVVTPTAPAGFYRVVSLP